jgi:DNA-binding transcriptional LysR family regulator
MLDGIEALMALEKYGTISEAAVRLRLTQSAVSKRIQALESELKIKLISPDGRRVKLTSSAYKFLNKARPLILELKNLGVVEESDTISSFSLGLSDSIAGSFGPLIVSKTLKQSKNLNLFLHVHRSLMLIENITLGKYQLGICTEFESRKDLISIHLYDEPLVLVSCELSSKFQKNLPLITIEENSATWKAISPIIKSEYAHLFDSTKFIFVESFLASFQMAKVGLGNALIPLGMAHELGLKKGQYRVLKLKRPISLVTRKTISQLDFFNNFTLNLKNNIKDYFENLK